MKIESQLSQHTADCETSLAIGVFDGVHLGHRHLVARLNEVARRNDRRSTVLTFENHPESVLRPDFEARYLTSVDERLRLIGGAGVELTIPVSFDIELSRLAARDFVGLLQDRLAMRDLVVGPDFAMGHKREGDVETLDAIGKQMGFSLHVVEPLLDDEGHPIRSTQVRDALNEGDVSSASRLLGRNFTLNGLVETGEGRGGPLGFPTVNLRVANGMAVPCDGIYATWAHVAGERLMAATSIGVRPTFGEGDRTVEAFVLDFEGDLYGQDVGLEFVRWIRPEVKFDTVEALQDQVQKDVTQTRAVLDGGQTLAEPETMSRTGSVEKT